MPMPSRYISRSHNSVILEFSSIVGLLRDQWLENDPLTRNYPILCFTFHPHRLNCLTRKQFYKNQVSASKYLLKIQISEIINV